ncbi:MAG TPA: biotin--[acetyl-CoA-carboxylase] ligase [Firmicutes bacterium]|nr:biotin--[acetyl-CoA-carboxylase] ligase [Bacillota bacterium]
METICTVLGWDLPHIQTIQLYETLPSTNDFAKAQIRAGSAHGTVIWALEQTAGRGRRGRPWFSDNTSLTFSIIWRFPDYTKTGLLPLALGLGIARELQAYSSAIKVKWPNDLWVGRHKLGGILCESIKTPQGVWVVAGVGINVNRSQGQVQLPRASLEECCGYPLARFEVLSRALKGANDCLAQLWAGELDLREGFGLYGNFLNRPICLISSGEERLATAREVLPDGSLLVEAAGGLLEAVFPEEVSLRFPEEEASSKQGESDKNRCDKAH